MYGSIAELIAGNPSFDIPGGRYKGTTPAMPGEDLRQIEEVYRGRPAPTMQDNLRPALPPVRKAANDLLEESIAQLAPQMVRNAVSPSDRLYIKTPSEQRANEMMMQRLGEQLSPADMRFFVEGNYGAGSV